MRDQFTPDGIVLERALLFWINRVSQAARTEMYRSFREVGEEVTPEQWAVLVRLWETDGRTQTELGQVTHHDRPTMSRILDGMAKRGWLVRTADETNARVWRVSLTKAGRALRKKLVPKAAEIVARLEAGVSARDLEITRATLERLAANLER
jgi:MarR family transcriptional regulator, organic hydroperoxide resistance regulator